MMSVRTAAAWAISSQYASFAISFAGSVVLARGRDGEALHAVAELDKERFGAESLERPALVRLGDGWRLYLSCATPGSKQHRHPRCTSTT